MAEPANNTSKLAGDRPSVYSATPPDRQASTKPSVFPLPEWLKLFLIAAMLDILRQMSSAILEHLHRACWVTVSFEDEDACYTWIMYWLSKHPSWRDARFVQATTRMYGVPSHGVTVPVQAERNGAARTLSYIPSTKARHTMWYNGYWTVVQRERVYGEYDICRESLHISFLTRDNSVVDELLVEAKQCYVEAQNDFVCIYAQDARTFTARAWRQVTARPKRPSKSIILERGTMERLLHDARDFLNSADWYAKRGIPFRRGYLLHGAPGTGKTSAIQSLAGELSLDIYMLTLNRAGLDDTTLHQLVAELPKRCIALIEDIDAVFRQDVSCRPSEEEPREGQYGGTGQEKKEEAHCRVSLSGLLNALDGIAAQEGRILFATTNHYRALDPALCRPGRMDLHLEFKLASKDQAARLFYRFYSDTRDDGDDEALYHGEDDLGTHTLQGVAPLSPPPTPPPAEAMSAVDDAGTSSTRDSEDPGTETDLRQLAARFADPIPEGRFSMADLQGYLMLYKDKPEEGVEAVEKWVKGQNAATMNA